jgi:hypothetical protein
MNNTDVLPKVIECIELTFEKCESCVIIRLAKAFSITASRVHNRVHKTSLSGTNFIRLSIFHTSKIHSLTAVLNINFPAALRSPT